MNNIFKYVTRDEATEEKLISGMNCYPDTAMQEFKFVKQQFGKTDGRTYYHIVQSFSPEDNITAETAHEIGLEFAEYFGYQTPQHEQNASMTITTGLITLLGDLLSTAPQSNYTPRPEKELTDLEKLRLEKILGRKIEPKALAHYSTQEEYEQAMGLTMGW